MDSSYILLIAFFTSIVLAFFLSSFYIKKKTKDMDIEAKKTLYNKNKKTRKLFGYVVISYIFLNLIVILLFKYNVISRTSNFYDNSSIYYVYGLVLLGLIGSFYTFNHYKLEKLSFGKIL